MADVDALLDEALQELDTRTYLTIDPVTRVVNTNGKLLLGVESDEGSNRVWFKCPRIVGDNFDLTTGHIRVNYENANKFRNSYLVEDVTVDGDNVIFSWKLSREVTIFKGTVKFIVCVKKADSEGVLQNEWNTTLATGDVLEGLETTQQIVEENYDILEQILLKLDDMDSLIADNVTRYLDENPVEAGATTKEAAQIQQNKNDIACINNNLKNYAKKTEVPEAYTLPIAKPTTLGGVKPIAKTDEMTQEVGVDELGGLFTKEGNVDETWKVLDFNITEPVATVSIDIPNAKRVFMISYIRLNDAENSLTTGGKQYTVKVNCDNASFPTGYFRTSGGYFNIHEIEKIDTFTKVTTTNTLGNGNAWSMSDNFKLCGWASTYYNRSETINNIEFSQYENGYLFMENCTWRIYYK